jgi:predicted esterase
MKISIAVALFFHLIAIQFIAMSMATADVMLIHGGQDRRAPIAHANRMRAALEEAGKRVVWHTDTLQAHGFAGEQGRTEQHKQIDEFLVPHMGWAPGQDVPGEATASN